jgi:hypothetical protein
MKTLRVLTVAALLAACNVAAAFAGGAGGLLFGFLVPEWNPALLPDLPAGQPGFETMGGFGYGVTRDGFIIGGFGLALLDWDMYDGATWTDPAAAAPHLAGGFGGLLVGSRVIGADEVHLDLVARLGFGGMATLEYAGIDPFDGSPDYAASGYAMVYAEPYAELGVGLAPWMHLAATLGYPVFANLIPGKPFSAVLGYGPQLGATLTWGSYR